MALDFTTGSAKNVNFGTGPTGWTNLDTLSWMSWIKWPSTWVGFSRIFRTSSENGPLVVCLGSVTDGVNYRRRRGNPNVPDDVASGNIGLSLNTWQFLAITYDSGAASGQRIKFYLGDLNTSAVFKTQGGTGSGALNLQSDAGDVFTHGTTSTNPFGGVVATFQLFNRVLTVEELVSLQFQPRNESGCIGFFHFGFNDISTQPNWTTNTNDGTVEGATVSGHVPLGPAIPSLETFSELIPVGPPPAEDNKIGLFHPHLRSDAWFDAGLVPEGMFNYARSQTHEFITAGVPPVPPTVSIAALAPASHVISPYGPQ